MKRKVKRPAKRGKLSRKTIERAVRVVREQREKKKPKIICICGSTRFADLHAIKRWELERDGTHICLMINYLPGWYAEENFGAQDHLGEAAGVKEILDELHFRKIDLCDEVLVINYKGYIGNSTRREIEYAEANGKPVRYEHETNRRI